MMKIPLLGLILSFGLTACGRSTSAPGEGARKSEAAQQTEASLSVAPPSTKTKKPPEAFRSFFEKHPDLKTVYVPIKPESLLSLNQALAQKGYGEVTASDFRPVYICEKSMVGNKEIDAHLAFTDLEKFRAYLKGGSKSGGTAHIPMTLHQCIQAALNDDSAQGIVFDPGNPGVIAAFDNYQLSILDLYLKSLPNPPEDLPLAVQILSDSGPQIAVSEEPAK